MKITAVTTQKNEGVFLLEWIAYHEILGFTDIVLLSNDCEDGSDEMLDHLSKSGEIIHPRNDGPYDDRGIQFAALKRADRQKAVKEADWIMHLDIDEFLNIHVEDGKITDLIAALPEVDAIALTWRMFGNNGIIEYKDRLITDQFARAAPKIMHWSWRAFMIKTLYRNTGIYGKLGVHRPKQPDSDRVKDARWFSGSGEVLPAIAALTSDKPSREFYKLQRARRDILRHLRSLLGQALARPGPLLTKLVCQHTLPLHPTAPKFVAALQQVEQTAAE